MSDKINWNNGGIKKEVLYTQERRNQIFSLIQEKKSVSVRELSEVFGISGTTIRLDLTDLEKTGLITRTHGGAVLRKNAPLVNREPQIHERANQEQKARIAACAVIAMKIKESWLGKSEGEPVEKKGLEKWKERIFSNKGITYEEILAMKEAAREAAEEVATKALKK